MRVRVLCLAVLTLSGCVDRKEPPGARPEASSEPAVVSATGEPLVEPAASTTPKGASPVKSVIGTERDNLPFEPDGTKIASIAWRNWVYTDTGPKRTRYGYLRAGAILDARGPAIVNDGCAGGWYRINPRGFVCVGKGATLDVDNPVVVASSVRPVRGQGLPYLYARAGDVPPLRYFRLPTKAEMKMVEGEGWDGHALAFKQRLGPLGLTDLLGEIGPPPDFVPQKGEIAKPYGVPQHLHFSVHAGRAAPDSGFAIQRVFEWEGRIFGLTTELDIIALDRTHVVKPSEFHGVELKDGESLPLAFVMQHFSQRYEISEAGPMVPRGSYRWREGVLLTGKSNGGGFLETTDGHLLAGDGTRVIKARDSFPSFATGTRKWIDISINDQSLVAYVGTKPVYVTLVSTGRGGLGDPEKTFSTARGTFMVHSKHVSATMDGNEDKSDSYNLLDVPFVQYFHKGFALHGTYWHDEFGKVRSHGCVNLSPIDAAWLFEWTDPVVPPGWHSVLNKDRGTVVFIHA